MKKNYIIRYAYIILALCFAIVCPRESRDQIKERLSKKINERNSSSAKVVKFEKLTKEHEDIKKKHIETQRKLDEARINLG